MVGKNKSVLKFSAEGGFSRGLDQIQTDNLTNYYADNEEDLVRNYQDNRTDQATLTMVTAYTQRIGKGLYLDPVVRLGGTLEQLDRVQGSLENGMVPVDSVSPAFRQDYRWIRTGFNFRWNTKKSQLSIGIMGEFGSLENSLNEVSFPDEPLRYFIPTFSWDYSVTSGRKFNLYYAATVNTPSVNQLLPVVNDLNPLNIYYGNPSLRPEYNHTAMIHWLIFDQFSFTSFMMALSGGYTRDKINWSTTVTDDLVQISTLANVDWDYNSRLNLDFSTPIRKLGIKINLDAQGSWNRGQCQVNEVNNLYNTLSHRYSLSADNRRKKFWDIESGVGMTLTNTWYDIQESLNNRYFDLFWFADMRYTPNEKWHFEVTADVTSYSELSADHAIRVPLLRAEVSRFFLAGKRGVLTLSVHDLLDRNQNVERISELNYLRETRSSTMGRYVMLTFKYRLSKMEREGGLEVNFNHRR
jgi:hypothetical protein